MALGRSRWTTFSARNDSANKLDDFLQSNSPSTVKRADGVAWISVHGPHNSEMDSDLQEVEDIYGLKQAWAKLKQLGKPITYASVRDLAKEYNSLSGKWLFYMATGETVDKAKAVVAGECGSSAKVSPFEGRGKQHVICIYCKDFTDKDSVLELEGQIRKAGIKCKLMYKPDAFTYMGIYSRNKWGLRPVIYNSNYDASQEKSKVTAVYD